MDFNKIPRWVLVWGFIAGMSIAGFMLKGAFADLDTTKQRSLRTEQIVEGLVETIDKIEYRQQSLDVKYDRNQEENQRVFRQILAAVKS